MAGELQGRSKLTTEQVRRIRALCLPQAEIARRYGINQSNVGKIRRRESWKHV